MHCPECYSNELYRSRRALPWRLWLCWPLLIMVRCHHCGNKFYRIRLTARALEYPKKRARREDGKLKRAG